MISCSNAWKHGIVKYLRTVPVILLLLLLVLLSVTNCAVPTATITQATSSVPLTLIPAPSSVPGPSPQMSPNPMTTISMPTQPLVQTISVNEVKDQLDSGYDFVLVDVRRLASFDSIHIDKAISIPLAELPSRYAEIPNDLEVIVYAACQ
jgi:hypothetical protein